MEFGVPLMCISAFFKSFGVEASRAHEQKAHACMHNMHSGHMQLMFVVMMVNEIHY